MSALAGQPSGGGAAPRPQTLPAVVTSPKNSAAYQVHSYPTKIPPEAIVPFIEACTKPGDVVLDPFCGSGMTGVAAQRCGRSALLSDLSPGAVHLARNHNRPPHPDGLLQALAAMERGWMSAAERALYGTTCPSCRGHAIARHTIWSDVHVCSRCGTEAAAWHAADPQTGSVPRRLSCPVCRALVARSGEPPLRSEPVHVVVSCLSGCRRLQRGRVPAADAAKLRRLARQPTGYWFPDVRIDATREMYKRSALHLRKVRSVTDFYLPRAKHALSLLWQKISERQPAAVRDGLRLAFTNAAWHASRMRRYNTRGGQRPLTGTLYIPQLTAEPNAFEVFRHQVVYADCNLIWEAWLGRVTDTTNEIVVSRSRTKAEGGKTVDDRHVITQGARPEGLSYRAFEALCATHFKRPGQHFTTGR